MASKSEMQRMNDLMDSVDSVLRGTAMAGTVLARMLGYTAVRAGMSLGQLIEHISGVYVDEEYAKLNHLDRNGNNIK